MQAGGYEILGWEREKEKMKELIGGKGSVPTSYFPPEKVPKLCCVLPC